MNRLVAIASPRSPVASPVASRNSVCSAPAAAAIALSSSPVGNGKSGLRVKSPVIVSWLLTMAWVRPAPSFDSASVPADTTRSQPSRRSAPPDASRTAWICSGVSAMRTWLNTAQPFFAELAGLALAQRPALDRHKARAEAFEAGVILVAARLIDRALAAELGLDRHDRQAVRCGRTIAAAFAD